MKTLEQIRDTPIQKLSVEELRVEVERLRERLGPRGLEVVMIGDTGHYVNEAIKTEINGLRSIVYHNVAAPTLKHS